MIEITVTLPLYGRTPVTLLTALSLLYYTHTHNFNPGKTRQMPKLPSIKLALKDKSLIYFFLAWTYVPPPSSLPRVLLNKYHLLGTFRPQNGIGSEASVGYKYWETTQGGMWIICRKHGTNLICIIKLKLHFKRAFTFICHLPFSVWTRDDLTSFQRF